MVSEQARAKKVLDFFNEIEQLMEDEFTKWKTSDDKDIEKAKRKFNKPVKAIGGVITKMTQRPFGFHFEIDDATYKIGITPKEYMYKRIK